jgi:formate C-acetyltransferase
MRDFVEDIKGLSMSPRIELLKEAMLDKRRYLSIEQAEIITRIYKQHADEPVCLKRARALSAALEEITIRINPGELIVGNRTPGIRGGVVFPESGLSWLNEEMDTLETRVQDRFAVREEDKKIFREKIYPYWQGKTLEDVIQSKIGREIQDIKRIVKINQKDHAQGHICPDTERWLKEGPSGIIERALTMRDRDGADTTWYDSVVITLEGAKAFMLRYAALADDLAGNTKALKDGIDDLHTVSEICRALAQRPAESFREALQSVWFLYVILQMESNASSFSPGRMDQYLYPFYKKDVESGKITKECALELIEALWLKFNQIVYMRNKEGAHYFAGFPIGFNIALGGQDQEGNDASNELSFLFLKAQELIGLPQPNLSARVFEKSPEDLLQICSLVISKGSGMPQIFNDESVIPALEHVGISHEDAVNYAIVGCVELTSQGNNLGWSDAAMFNLVKVLELTLTGGECLIDKVQKGCSTGTLVDYQTFSELEDGFREQIDRYIRRMITCCEVVEQLHAEILPSPFLSSVINDCLERGLDVTAGGSHYNLSGIQVIQPANIADSLATLKKLVFDEQRIDKKELLEALKNDFEDNELLRQLLLNKVPKYGNDVEWVDELGNKWISYFANQLKEFRNWRGGPYHAGMYTVSAHVPMGKNVGATPDGRHSGTPLADGGLSAVYGRDMQGPTALLRSVNRIDSINGSNGTLLNMKFSPDFFKERGGIDRFAGFLRAFAHHRIHHVQFNVLSEKDLLQAKKYPEKYRSLTVRVAGYTAYFIELASDLQDEIIARTTYTGIL